MTSPAPLTNQPAARRANWLNRYLEVERRLDSRLRSTLLDSLSGIDDAFTNVKDSFSGKVRRQQLAASKREVKGLLEHIFGITHENIKDLNKDAAVAAVDAELYEERGVLARIFSNPVDRRQYADSLRATARRNVQNVVSRHLFSEKPLSARVYKTQALANNQVAQAVNRALARGDSAKDLADSVKHLIDPATPGGISYAARRLGRTELNNAFHATSIQTAQDTPWVQQMEWHLSKVHEPDDCDCEKFAQIKLFDIEHVPEKPHPNCRCYVTPVQQNYEDFENALLSGQYDQYLDEALGEAPVGQVSREEWEWPEGTTDRVRAEYEKAIAKGKTSIWPQPGWTAAEKRAAQKISSHMQAAAEAAEIAEQTAAQAARIIDDIVPDSIGAAKNSKQVANYLSEHFEGLELEGFDFADVDVRAAQQVAEGFTERFALNERTNIRSIRIVDDLPLGVNAETRYNIDRKGFSDIFLSRKNMANFEGAKSDLRKSLATGHFSRNARLDPDKPLYYTFVHEWGHVLDYSADARTSKLLSPMTSERVWAATGVKQKMDVPPVFTMQWYKEKVNPDFDLENDFLPTLSSKNLSDYQDWFLDGLPSGYSFRDRARTKMHTAETVAESYLEYSMNPNRSSVSKLVYDKLTEDLNEYAKRVKVKVKRR